jgi:hypothetical protein
MYFNLFHHGITVITALPLLSLSPPHPFNSFNLLATEAIIDHRSFSEGGSKGGPST